jgi:hypothetical protein
VATGFKKYLETLNSEKQWSQIKINKTK